MLIFCTLCKHIVDSIFTKPNANEAAFIKPFKDYFDENLEESENEWGVAAFFLDVITAQVL